MGFKRTVKLSLNKLLATQGYTLARQNELAPAPVPPPAPPPSPELTPLDPMEQALAHIRARNHGFKTVIDVGASDGRWTEMAMRQFPECKYLLVEAQPVHARALEAFAATHPNAQIALAAAGERPGQINFDATDPFGGIASENPFPHNNIVVPVTTLDAEIKARNLAGPYLLKLDTHGFEVPILNGASEVLARAEVVLMECYNFKIAPQCMLFHEMTAHMATRGFRCIDLIEPKRRPLDNCLWQMDLVFARNNRTEFSAVRYQ